MKMVCRISSSLAGLLIGLHLLLPPSLASAETLAEIDREIQASPAFKAEPDGFDAYNIYEGVTNSRLDRKISILLAAGINPRFFQTADGSRDYTNFYSFTGRAGVTDTRLDLVTTNSTLRLYRRGNSGYKEAMGYLGSWWGGQYRGIQGSRDELAILAAWGSDLQRIYVIDMPAGYTLVGGLAAPMEKNGEYRNGGGYQYYYRGASTGWLVYALYAPDYLKSYSGAVTSAQKAGRSIATDLGDHLNQTRSAVTFDHAADDGEAIDRAGEFWFRGFGGNLDYSENDGSSVSSQTGGMSIGWQRMISGKQAADQSRSYLGLMVGQGINLQKYDTSDVENDSRATVGGIYGLYMQNPVGRSSWYGSCSLLYGGLSLNNTVPGELGYGLDQEYDGNISVLTVENGISFRRDNGWSLEPQLQLSYTRIDQSDFNDNLGARVSLEQGDSFWGRLGLEVRKTLSTTDYRKLSVWTRLSYIHDFSDPNEVSVAGDLAVSELDPNRYVVAVGTDLELNQRWSLQGQIEEVFDGERGVQGNLALKYTW
jgi:outer membrane autotransporter protein